MARSRTRAPSSTATKTQTVRINGARVKITTKAGKVTTKPAGEEEWVLQAAVIKALRAHPAFAVAADKVRPGTFTLAGDFNAARRSMREAAKAKATGLTPGEHDIRLYLYGGVLGLIEMKAKDTPVSKAQKDRHALLHALGFDLQAIVRATATEEAEAAVRAILDEWLAISKAA
ncbi:VRR-NUC domain-containing protein [Ochrobactrum teleogrylli]|uniref:VRR-NUC domain-containing protein n=1 Tax=Ochrobactrum teleogrylli TaxID=2479765 RepID=UPI00384CED79